MRVRRLLVLLPIVLAVAVLYNLALVILVSTKVLGFDQPFDSWSGAVVRTTESIGPFETDVYSSPRSHTPVLLVHGVNESGKDSPAVHAVAKALAGAGFRVMVPVFVRLTQQNVTPADIDDIEFVLRSIDQNAGLICSSYGCGPALIAAARPAVRDRVLFVATFGAYYDLTQTLRFIVTSPPSNLAYSKWRYMATNVDLLPTAEDQAQIRAIAAERIAQPAESWLLTGEPMSAEGRALLSLYESSTASEFDNRLGAVPRLRERTAQLSPSRYLEGIRAPLIILHMNADPCVSSSESVRLAEAAKAYGIPNRLVLFHMHGHTKPELPPLGVGNLVSFYLPESLQFLRVIHEVLSYASNDP